MAWKLKKSNTSAIEAEPAVDSAPLSADNADDSLDFATGVGPSEVVFASGEQGADGDGDLLASRIASVDETIAALTNSRKLKPPSAPPAAAGNGAANATGDQPAAADHDEAWSLDAFAPYRPADRPAGEDAEEEIDFAPQATTDAESHFPEPIALGTVDLDAADAQGLGKTSAIDDSEWQLGEVGASNGHGLVEESDEPVLGGIDATLPSSSFHDLGNTSDGNGIGIDIGSLYSAPADPAIEAPSPDLEKTLIAPAPDAAVPPAKSKPVVSAPAAAPILVVRLGQFAANYDLASGEQVIGRPDPTTGSIPDIAIEWDDAISRRHARVFAQSGSYYVEDLGSKNGTRLNGQVLPAETPVALNPGDVIHVGERTEITFQA